MSVGTACPACGEPVFGGEAYCEACGNPLDGRPHAASCAECGGIAFSEDGYCERCGIRRPDEREHVEISEPAAAGVSDRGLRHSRNEDAVVVTCRDDGVIAVVCDGVSSSPRPQDASLAAAQAGAAALAECLAAGADPRVGTRAGCERAAASVTALAESAYEAPACTYVSALVAQGSATLGWVGDSRAYWLSGAKSRLLTADDSWAARAVARGEMSEAEAEAHPNAHVLTEWLGADADTTTDPHVTTFVPDGPGTVLVCSDGLWNHVSDAVELAAAADDAGTGVAPLDVARHLVRLANDAGGHDNVTVVVIPFSPGQPTTEQAE